MSRVRRVRVLDVHAGAPDAQVVGEQDVRRQAVAKPYHGLREARYVVRQTGQLGKPGGGDLRGHRRGVVTAGHVLDVTPQVWLHVEHLGAAGLVRAPEEQLEVLVVGLHGRGVLEVAEVRALLVRVVLAGQRLANHVVGEDGRDVVRQRLARVHARERAVRVPGGPAGPGVHATGQVLVAEAEGRAAAQGGRTAGRVGQAELDAVRGPAAGRLGGERRCGEACSGQEGCKKGAFHSGYE